MDNVCILCCKTLTAESPCVKKPTRQGYATIFSAAEKRKDAISLQILSRREEINANPERFKYHISCRKSFCSKNNIDKVVNVNNPNITKVFPSSSGRSGKKFDIKSDCLICGKSGTYRKKNLISISTGTGSSTREKILKSAVQRGDDVMQGRMKFYTDLFAADAKYHSACYAQYISNRKQAADETQNSMQDAFNTLFKKIAEEILQQKKCVKLSTLYHQKDKTKVYVTPKAINPINCRDEIPDSLYKFLTWIMNERFFNDLSEDKFDVNVIAICSSILNGFDKINFISTLSLGLSIYIYQTVRSKKILDILYNFGYGISYDEMRKFLTSIATDQIESTESNIFIPQGLIQVNNQNDNLIHASIDNFDLNEETLDGKATTHSMAMVIFQKNSEILNKPSIERQTKRSLGENTNFSLEQELISYKKPTQRPEPQKFGKNILENCFCLKQSKGITTDKLWMILRYKKNTSTFIGWSEFNNIISSNNLPVSNVFYYPFINAPPSTFDTIFTALVQLVKIAENIGQDHIVVTADLAIYCKAREILWNNPPALSDKVTMQLGGMHLMMAFIASIGSIFTDGGLINILVESGVYAEASCRQMLQGKHLYRSIRGILLVSDTLHRLLFKSMELWLEENHGLSLFTEDMQDALNNFENMFNEKHSIDEYEKTLGNIFSKSEEFNKYLIQFIEFGCQNSPTFKYWFLFIEAADILLKLLRSERNADFELHLEAVQETLPFLRAGGRSNYARYTPIYLLDMENLKLKKPKMYQYLKNGNFVVRRTDTKKFNCVASDMALEQTINRDCKSSGGVVGFTRSEPTLVRWLITRHLMGEYSSKVHDLISNFNKNSKMYSMCENLRDEEDINKMLDLVESTWVNPFNTNNFSKDLIHIATGKVASDIVKQSISNIKEHASLNVKKFVEERLSCDGNVSFWKAVPRDQTKFFAFDKISFKQNVDRKETNPEFMFRRIISAVQFKELDLADILSYELTPVPVSIFNEDGTMRKTAKSDLANKLESLVTISPEKPQNIGSYFIDGMLLFLELNEKTFKTFEDLGDVILKKLMRIFNENPVCCMVSIVFDRYDMDDSIKSAERQRRGQHKIGTYSIVSSRKVPNYKDFLKSTSNKMSLIKFVTQYLIKSSPKLPPEKVLWIAGGLQDGSMSIKVKNSGVTVDELLQSNHEEADTRLIFHLVHSSTGSPIVVKSDDTDVLVLLIYFYWNDKKLNASEIYMEKGHNTTSTNKKRFVPIHLIAQNLQKPISDGLPAFHAITGCDTTNSFFKIGKKSAWQIYFRNHQQFDLHSFGKTSIEQGLDSARKFTLSLYRNDKCKDLNEVRQKMTKETKKSAKEIPPTEDAFYLHVLRCYYQVRLWTMSHIGLVDRLDPKNYGWTIDTNNCLSPKFTNKTPIPDEIRKVISLFCTEKNCNNSKCACKSEGVFCSSDCKCNMKCTNIEVVELLDDAEDDLLEFC
ncbi:unnamed protein product [Ceutorhynchus assimilis]|uniref:Uncharacterized protein n=1 Tax=Ceutorhynchus assimilis TaxID=467358 RepID=A0A9N9QKN7_9CUCU|nr:unnamed protein product [Ceutorhynchus assimilis]